MAAKTKNDDPWLETMRGAYLSKADEKLSALDTAIRSLERSPGSPTAYRNLDKLLHNLTGSGGSYGMPEVSNVARRMLTKLKSCKDDPAGVSDAALSDLRAGRDDLRHIFEEARSRQPAEQADANS